MKNTRLKYHVTDDYTFACLAVEYGMPIDVLAKILGHSNTNMTRHYARILDSSIMRNMQTVAKAMDL